MRQIDFIKPIYEIFTNKNWHNRAESSDVLFNLTQLLSNLDTQQQNLLFELINRYNWFSEEEIKRMLIDITNKLSNAIQNENYENIYALPLKSLKKSKTLKSPDPLIYKLNSLHFKIKENLKNVKILTDINDINKNSETKDLILFFDDFIGSGNSAKTVIDELFQIIKDCDVYVMSLVGMKQGILLIEEHGVKCIVSKEFKKEISDYYPIPKNEENLIIMDKIENLINLSGYKYGYCSSEALVTLDRTPNNTFPIFWADHKKDGTVYRAPFPRF